MFDELRDLYQELILDHSKRPRNFGRVEHATCQAAGHNPLCGDRLTIYLLLDGDRIRDVAFEGSGCAISTASASLMTEMIKGKTEAEVRAIFGRFHEVVAGKDDDVSAEDLDKLAVFAGVRDYPVRVKCATLPWHTLVAALDGAKAEVSTE